MIAPINIVAHEQVVRLWTVASNAEELQKILELPMDIATDCNRAFHWLDVGLIYEDITGFITQRLHITLWQGLALFQLLDLRVQ